MTPERLREIERLFHEARERTPAERDAFLARACAHDPTLRREVESLLAQPPAGVIDATLGALVAELVAPPAPRLAPGSSVGPYRIERLLAVGGMGEVYRARDTTLGRDVAIKILPRHFTADPERLARFEREARMLAALNHPNIGAIYGLEAAAGGVRALVLELVEGETVADRIQRGPVPVTDALTIARQIADALEAAHEKGIIHRDLKPANIKITPGGVVKVLDFGLAKAATGELQSPAVTVGSTQQGTILGTAAYMSPEQARGQAVDKRTDIWAFGCVLYEMLTGRAAFAGDTISDTIAAILERESDLSKLPATTPPGVRRLLQRCLAKDPKRRLRDIGDADADLDDVGSTPPILSAPAVPRPSRSWVVAAALTLAVVAGVIGALVWRDRDTRPESPAVSFTAIPLTTYQGREQQPAFSPDGNSVAFSWNGETEDNWDIYVKLIGPGSPQRLTTDPAMDLSPAWSPDGRSIALVRIRGGRLILIVVPSRGGPEREVLETLKVGGLGFGQVLSWSADSRILVVGASPSVDTPEVLMAVDVATGETRPVTTPPLFPNSDALPSVSPDGRMLAFVRRSGVLTGELYVQALSAGFAPVGEPRRLRTDGRFYHGVAWTADGRDVIVSSGNQGDVGLWRIPLRSPEQLERLSPSDDEWRQPAVAMQQDRLAFTRARWDDNIWSLALSPEGRAAGSPVKLIGSTRSERNARFSPDGTRVAFEGQGSGTQEVWVADRDGRNALQLTSFNGGQGGTAAWSPDGKSIAYDLRNEDGRGDIYVIPARSGAPLRITTHPADDLVPSWSHDGQSIYFGSTRSGTSQIWKQSPQGGEPVQVTQHGGSHGKESVDGRYLYYSRTSSFLASLWRVPVSGGEEVQVLREIAGVLNFAVARDGIYFESSPPSSPLGHIAMLTPFTRPKTILDFLSFATRKVTRVITLDRRAALGLDVSPDGRTLLFAQSDSFTEDLMLVENFR